MQLRLIMPMICGLCLLGGQVFAQPGGTTTGADVIVGGLPAAANWGSGFNSDIGQQVAAFSIATTSCNIGDENLLWIASNNQHPVISQNVWRIEDGILEHVGQGWLKHGFFALSQNLCSGGGCQATSGTSLGVGCSDPYTANRNGNQGNLGPRSQVNATTGFYPFPYSAPPAIGNIARRVQVPHSKLAPSSGSTTLSYYVDGHYVTPDDAAAGNHMNNVSVRRFNISASGSSFNLTNMGGQPTIRQTTMPEHWAALDSEVELQNIDDGNGGRIQLATKVWEVAGLWHYEYLVYNVNSHLNVKKFMVDLPAGGGFVNVEYNGIHHHSGEPTHFGSPVYNNDPWTLVESGSSVSWNTTEETAAQSNPIRWGTAYNFRFTTPAAPTAGQVTVSAWRSSDEFVLSAQVPNGDFLPAVENLSCDYTLYTNEASLNWTNGASYTSIEVLRNGAVVATLAGTDTSYVDNTATPGENIYSLLPSDGVQTSYSVSCDVIVSTQAKLFAFVLNDSILNYDENTGFGFGEAVISGVEAPNNASYPNNIAALQLALTYDPNFVEISEVSLSAFLDSESPEFFAPAVFEDTNGVTIGLVMSFAVTNWLVLDGPTELFNVSMTSNATTMIGDVDGAEMPLFFEDGVHGLTGTIDGLIDLGVGGELYNPMFENGVVSLVAGGPVGTPFVRSDANGDGAVDVSDPVYALSYMFQAGPANCLKAMDSNDDGLLNVADPVYSLAFQFTGGASVPAPFPACGFDPTDDALTCESVQGCP